MSVALNIEVPDELASRLEQVASRTGAPVASFIRDAVVMHIEDIEDGFEALEVKNDPNMTYYTTDELKQNLGLSDPVE